MAPTNPLRVPAIRWRVPAKGRRVPAGVCVFGCGCLIFWGILAGTRVFFATPAHSRCAAGTHHRISEPASPPPPIISLISPFLNLTRQLLKWPEHVSDPNKGQKTELTDPPAIQTTKMSITKKNMSKILTLPVQM
ncbi:hypothetical protein PCASD_05624 [Puccinia coronata f. sp. avenae]|uniref:Uncharacterized protein n=1 Tax=Puccinia coronata f. sp. avenae TaxID=200324 RepID=A0A2N5UWN8_9BASI|nr:hypothetical protein PCASD_05624 [Puccinia coronata f. sp. avenae]